MAAFGWCGTREVAGYALSACAATGRPEVISKTLRTTSRQKRVTKCSKNFPDSSCDDISKKGDPKGENGMEDDQRGVKSCL